MAQPRAFQWVLAGGLIAATLDIVFALLFYGSRGSPPLRILQSIASGILGREAYQGGLATALLGLALHFAILIVAAFVFYAAARRLWLTRWPILSGAAFGLCVFAFMNFLVVPFSAFPHKQSFPPEVLIPGLLIHMFGVGVPIALCVRRALRG